MKCLWTGVVALLAVGCGGAKLQTQIGANDSAIQYEGRVEKLNDDGPQFSLPGTRVTLGFTGTSLSVRLRDFPGPLDDYGNEPRNHYDVLIDGQRTHFEVKPGEHTYALATGLPEGSHTLKLTKRTDVWIGETQLLGFVLDADARVNGLPRAERRIEFIGDALTVGLGVAAPGPECDYSAEFMNHTLAFPTLVGEALNAETVSVAASGVGVVVNYLGDTENTMPNVYSRALLARPDSQWSFDWKPQAVVVNLGTSDFTRGDPGRQPFVDAYVKLLKDIRAKYPETFILVVTGPSLTDVFPVGVPSATRSREYTQAAITQRKAEGESRLEFFDIPTDDGSRGYGCDYHPSAATHRLMADLLTAELKKRMGW